MKISKLFDTLLLVVIILLFSCDCKTNRYSNIIKNIFKMQNNIIYNGQNVIDVSSGKQFDINNYFKILENIELEKNYKLGYYYIDVKNKPSYGMPIIIPYTTSDSLKEQIDKIENTINVPIFLKKDTTIFDPQYFLKHIEIKKTDGYFDFIIIYIMGNQFGLKGMSISSKIQIIYDRNGLENIYKFIKNKNGLLFSLSINPVPKVVEYEKEIMVDLILFSRWKGLYEMKYFISKSFPHKIIRMHERMILEYNHGVIYLL